MRALPIIVAIFFVACGSPDIVDSENGTPSVALTFRQAGDPLHKTAASPVQEPITLRITLVGPDGSRTEEVPFADRQIKLGPLGEGKWSIRGDGMDAASNLTWSAKPTIFQIQGGKSTPVELVFEPIVN